MLLEKTGFPEEGELVIVTVTRVNPNSVFCTLDHYGGRTGLIHISEISPGRIRNIRDYVIEGKKIVCKVLSVDEAKGHIDLSLRRVTEMQKRQFTDSLKHEQKAEKLLTFFGEENKIDKAKLNGIIKTIGKDYEYIYEFFNDVNEGSASPKDYFPGDLGKKLEAFVKEKIKPSEAEVKGVLHIMLFGPDGVEDIKAILKGIGSKNTSVAYKGAGQYSILVKAKEVKEAEKLIKSKAEQVEKAVEIRKGVFSFERK